MTTLERRCRLLLRAYPPEYRKDRGEEIIGTLLEATPAGRSWPLARDIGGLLGGGLQARVAQNRQLTTVANLRMATLIGVSAFLALRAVNELHGALLGLTAPAGGAHAGRHPVQPLQAYLFAPRAPWLLIAAALSLVAVAVAWVSSRRTVVLAAAMAAVGALLLPDSRFPGMWLPITDMVCLTALPLVAGGHERPGRRWLWPMALVAAWPPATTLVPGFVVPPFFMVIEALGVLSVLWVVVDARPAVAVAVFALVYWLRPGITGPFNPAVLAMIVSVLAPVLVWRLHRQSARAPARRES